MNQPKRLPGRAAVAVERAERQSEVSIGWFELGFALFLGVLYLLAPRGYASTMVPFRPVPAVLMVYIPLTLFRLWLAYRDRMNGGWVIFSILLDVSVVIVLIWSYHLQYDQPAPFSLKAPTFMYLFVFVAMRAQRYNPFYVIFAGISAMIGWTILTLYTIAVDGTITRDFVEYLTTNTILVGAQVDKIVAIGAITVIMAIGVAKSRQILGSGETERIAREDLTRFLNPQAADRITATDNPISPGDGEVRVASIFMVDIRGFSEWADSAPPPQVMAFLAEYQAQMIPAILSNGGGVDKFLGDGILAQFGAAQDSGTHAADAMRALEELCVRYTRWDQERKQEDSRCFRIGMSCVAGPVVFGAVGDQNRLEFTVIGSGVNLCAKLEKHNKRSQTMFLTTEETFALARKQGFQPTESFRRYRQQHVEGFSHPLDLVGIPLPDRT